MLHDATETVSLRVPRSCWRREARFPKQSRINETANGSRCHRVKSAVARRTVRRLHSLARAVSRDTVCCVGRSSCLTCPAEKGESAHASATCKISGGPGHITEFPGSPGADTRPTQHRACQNGKAQNAPANHAPSQLRPSHLKLCE